MSNRELSKSVGGRPEGPRDDPLVGQTIAGKYHVLEILGRGGYGTVYLVEIVAGMVGEKLALKIIPDELSHEEKVRQRFINEIRVAMRLVNKYIVQVRDVGVTPDGHLYYTMDYSPGVTLARILRREGRLSVPRSILIVLRILRALFTAHDQGVIHRDLKPANIMVESRNGKETARILDFGIATAMDDQGARRGTFVGSPYYMPPEQFLGEKLGPYTDLYSTGVILYECLTGQRPYHGRSAQAVFEDMKSRPPVSPAQFNPDVEAFPGLAELTLRALERNPERRFQSAREFFGELNKILETWKAEQARKAEPRPAAPRPRGRPRTGARGRPAPPRPPSAPPRAPAAAKRRANPAAAWQRRRMPLAVKLIIAVAVLVSTSIVGFVFKDEIADLLAPAPRRPGGTPGRTPGDTDSGPDREPYPWESQEVLKPPRAKPEAEMTEAERGARLEAEELLEKAKVFASTDEWGDVRQACDEALRQDGTLPELYLLKGRAETRLELWKHAYESLRTAEVLLPAEELDADLYVDLATVRPHVDGGDVEETEMYLRKALELDPSSVEATVMLLELLDRRRDETAIRVALNRAVEEKIEHARVAELREKWFETVPRERAAELARLQDEARTAFGEGRFADAIESGSQAFARAPGSETGLLVAEAYRAVGQYEKSLEMLRSVALELRASGEDPDPALLATLALAFGETYLHDHTNALRPSVMDLERARLNLSSAIDLLGETRSPDGAVVSKAYTLRARCHAIEGAEDGVEADLRAAMQADDRDPALILHQGRSLYMLAGTLLDPEAKDRVYSRAIARLGKVRSIREATAPQSAMAYFLSGLCYLELGERDDLSNASKRFFSAEKAGMETPELYAAWGDAFSRMKKHFEAAAKYRQSFELKADENSCEKAVNSFLQEGLKKQAEEILSKGLALYPDSKRLTRLLPFVRE